MIGADEPEIGFVNQGGCLQRLAGLLFRQSLRRQLAQLVIDEGQELVGSVRVPLFDGR
jgi:hypothetical protein